MSTQPLRVVDTVVIAVRPTDRISFDCEIDGAPCLCIAVGATPPQRITLQPGQRVAVQGRQSDVVHQVFEVELITPVE